MFQFNMSELSSVLLAVAMVAAGVLCAICATSPTPEPAQKSRQRDRLGFIVGTFPTIGRRIMLIVVMYHALLVIIPHYAPGRILQVCPQPQNPKSELFTWNVWSVAALLLVYVGAYVRLSAYGGLGKFFTFHLTVPDHLVTTGVYRWVQHPSYTGVALVAIGVTALFTRWDGTPACWIPESVLAQWQGWGLSIIMGTIGLGFWALGIRVRDEEDMLKQKFGQQWEEWHRSTKRFIPGLL
jgi:protein-S-isoprenylcysteine O-methyltransferase Ste14